ncbi:MAG: hypothetical protein AB1420_16820 [Bacillota bacterium]
MSASQLASFLIRIWREGDERRLMGQIEHIQSGQKLSFTGMESLQAILEDFLLEYVEKSQKGDYCEE